MPLFCKNPNSDMDDTILTDLDKIKIQKKDAHELHSNLKNYAEHYRKFAQSKRKLFTQFEKVYEESWSDRDHFKNKLNTVLEISDNTMTSLAKQTLEKVVIYLDTFQNVENEVENYKKKMKQYLTVKKKLETAEKKSSEDTINKLTIESEEKRVPCEHVRQKLRKDMPKFYDSRMDVYSEIWSSFFHLHLEMAKCEANEFEALLFITKNFIDKKNEGVYDTEEFNISSSDTRSIKTIASEDDGLVDLSGGQCMNQMYAELNKPPSSSLPQTPSVPTKHVIEDSPPPAPARARLPLVGMTSRCDSESDWSTPSSPTPKLSPLPITDDYALPPSKPQKPKKLENLFKRSTTSFVTFSVLRSFEGTGDNAFSVDKSIDEYVECTSQSGNFSESWLFCRKSDGTSGYIPSWCVKSLDQE